MKTGILLSVIGLFAIEHCRAATQTGFLTCSILALTDDYFPSRSQNGRRTVIATDEL